MNAKQLYEALQGILETNSPYDMVEMMARVLRDRAERDESDADLENAELLERLSQNINQAA
jgi:hypothetical protein